MDSAVSSKLFSWSSGKLMCCVCCANRSLPRGLHWLEFHSDRRQTIWTGRQMKLFGNTFAEPTAQQKRITQHGREKIFQFQFFFSPSFRSRLHRWITGRELIDQSAKRRGNPGATDDSGSRVEEFLSVCVFFFWFTLLRPENFVTVRKSGMRWLLSNSTPASAI